MEQELVENMEVGVPRECPPVGSVPSGLGGGAAGRWRGEGKGRGPPGRPKCHLHGGPCPGGAVALRTSTLCGWGVFLPQPRPGALLVERAEWQGSKE